jgi:hypothetical protein
MSIFHGDNTFAELQSSSLVIFTRITSDRSWKIKPNVLDLIANDAVKQPIEGEPSILIQELTNFYILHM